MATRQEESPSPAGESSTFPPSLWRNRDYLLLWSGQTISGVGSRVSGIAFPLLVLLLTNSPAQAGFIGALSSVPYLLLSLPFGALIDRWDRKRVMILCDTGRALALGSIPLAYVFWHVTLVQLYLAALVEGTLFVLFDIAEVACLPRVVNKEQLPAATGQNQASGALSSLVGPSLGGTLYGISLLAPFLVDALSYGVSVGSLFLIRATFQEERAVVRRKLWAEITEGVLWLWHHALFRFMAFLTGGINFVLSGSSLILIVLAQHEGASAPIIGVIFSIGALGILVGSLIAGTIQKRFSYAQAIIGSCWLMVLIWPLYALMPPLLVLGIILAAFSLVIPIYNVMQFSYRSALIPDAFQGRVNSVVRLIAYGFQPLGQALTGVLLEEITVVPTVLVFGGGLLLLACAAALNPHVRNARPLAEVQANATSHLN
jgi:MFS family permease